MSDVVEISVSDLVTGYAGQSSMKTHDVLVKARGKVLFIDEAYRLNPNNVSQFQQIIELKDICSSY